MNTTMELYLEGKKRRIWLTKIEFSTDWLGMSPAYFAAMGEGVAVGSLLTLWENLQQTKHFDLQRDAFDLMKKAARHPIREGMRRAVLEQVTP